MPDETTASDAAQPRRKLGKYELVERFERGGMATVYKAYDPTLDRYVAIKQIAAHLADDPRFVERFRHEAQVLAKLGDEAAFIVTIHELVEDEVGGLYIVMEYVEGRTLETFLQQAPISPAAAIKLMAQIARGLRAVHNKGIVHRDVKPLNIIITPQGRVKITDFGLAARTGGDTSMSMGTTKYMAPELFKGGSIDARADLYSVGLMMYELLCPMDRFNEVFDDVLGDERGEGLRWMSWHADPSRVVPPLTEVNDKVPKRMSLLIERLMAKDADQRVYSADELIQELKSAFGRRSGGTESVAKDLSATQMPGTEAVPVVGVEGGEARPRRPGAGDTAPLPKTANWRKRGIIIGAAAAVLIIGLLLARRFMPDPARDLERDAKKGLAEAEKHFEQGEHDEAAPKFRKYLEWAEPRFPEHPKVIEVKAKAALSEAYNLLVQKQWDDAKARADEAFNLGMDPNRIRRFKMLITATKTFHDLLARADDAAEKDLHDQALKLLDQADLENPAKTEADQRQIEQRRTDFKYRKAMYEGQQALDAGNWAEARAKYLAAKQLRATAEVDARLQHIAANERFYRAFSAGQEAFKRNDFRAAVQHLQQALTLQADKKVADLLTEARYQQKMGEARRLESRGAWSDALKAYEVAKGIKPTGEVQSRIDAVKREMEVDDLDRQVNEALTANDIDKAIDLLGKRLALKASLEAEARRTELRFQREMQRGRAFEREGQWDEALEAFKEALRIKTSPEADRAIREVQQRKKYTGLVAQGDRLFGEKLYEQALEVYREAKEVQAGEEIDKKIDGCQYEIFMRAGREQEEAGNFSGAYANYRRALNLNATEDAKQAVARVKDKVEP